MIVETAADLIFAATLWHVVSAALVFFLGGIAALLQYRVFEVPHRLALGLYVWHTLFCLAYLIYSQSNVADATSYFLEGFAHGPFRPGTTAVRQFTAVFSQWVGLSYGGVFLVFNIIGFVGMLALASVLRGLLAQSSRPVRLLALTMLFLPGLSFWSAAIGKDAITFLAACLACWASLDLIKRFPAMALAAGLMFLARPHMAAVLLLALAGAIFISARISAAKRFLLLMMIVPSAYFALMFAQGYVGLGDARGLAELWAFIAERQVTNTEGALAIDIANMSIPMRMLSLVYRPFFEVGGVFGAVISVENVILLLFSMLAIGQILRRSTSALPPVSWWFMVIFALITWLMLSSVVSNLGIAMRQKWMFMPMLLILGFSYFGRGKPAQASGAK